MRKDVKITTTVLFLFAFITLIQLFPLSLNPGNSVHDIGDPLLNTWILSWVQKQLFSNPLKLFDANIFYPLSNTLSFSELLFPQAILSLPIYYLSKNPILSYNFVFLLSYFLCAYAMFLLVRHLTENAVAGIASGVIFAFNAYHLDHTPHVQLISSCLIPFSFLFLHKFFENKNVKNSLLFSFLFTLQALACIYYGLFFLSILIIILPTILILYFREIKVSFLFKLAIPLIFSGSILFIFFLPYNSLFKSFGFKRSLAEGAELINYLGTSSTNVFLGEKLSAFGDHESRLFPGIAVLLLSGFYIFQKRKLLKHIPKILIIATAIIVLINLIMIIIIKLIGGINLKLGIFTISAHNSAKQAFSIFVVGILYVLFSFFSFIFRKKDEPSNENRNLFLYIFLFFWALFLSFGGMFTFMGESLEGLSLPFKWFYNFFPGFKGIRVPSRYAVFVIFSLSVLAGYGFKYLFARIKKKQIKVTLTAVLLIFINLEYLKIPHKISFIPVKKDIPLTYRWLKENKEDFALIELPFLYRSSHDAIYMYFSLYHGKKIVNGYSGFLPPINKYLRGMFDEFPSQICIDILKSLKVKYVILHTKNWEEKKAAKITHRIRNKFKADLKLVKEFNYSFKKPNSIPDVFGKDLAYEVNLEQEEKIKKLPEHYQEIPPTEWEIKASINERFLPFLKDNNPKTRWKTGRAKKTGDFLLVEFKEPLTLAKVSLHFESFPKDFALDIKTKISLDGKEWQEIRSSYSPLEFVKTLISSRPNFPQNVYLMGRKLKYLKLVHIGDSKKYWWSVAELKIYK